MTPEAQSPEAGPGARTQRILLSPPDLGPTEAAAVMRALESGWGAPLGPEVDAFEEELAVATGRDYAIALSSGTAAIHLALLAAGIGSGDRVIVPTLTFAATAFAVSYVGALPVFVDVEQASWNLDPDLLATYLRRASARSCIPRAMIVVDIFGRPADYVALEAIAAKYGVVLISDAAESLGAIAQGTPAGARGLAACISFNGNKIITTSGGGALVTDDESLAARVRFLATQAREPVPWYEHHEVGYNYRLSNLLAAIGRVQLRRLEDIVDRRRTVRDWYSRALLGVDGVSVASDPPWGVSNAWLTTATFDPARYPDAPSRVIDALQSAGVEARHVWRPMHMQPVFQDNETFLSGMAERLFHSGVCLPSHQCLTASDVEQVAETAMNALRANPWVDGTAP